MKKIIILFAVIFSSVLAAGSKEYTAFPKPVIVTFYSKDCEECDLIELVKVENKIEYNKTVDFIDINFDDDDCDFDALKKRYNVTKAPTTLFIGAEKGVTKKVVGYLPFKIYQKNIESIIPDNQEN